MIYRALADAVAVIHLAFIAFALLGGLLVLRWHRLIWLHVPAALWGALVAFFSWPCPLTPLENRLRQAGGADAYSAGFVEQYLLPVLYPGAMTRELEAALGGLVVVVNIVVYLVVRRRLGRARQRSVGREA